MDPFEVLKIEERGVVVRDGNGGTLTVEMHQAVGPWSLMALLEKNGVLKMGFIPFFSLFLFNFDVRPAETGIYRLMSSSVMMP